MKRYLKVIILASSILFIVVITSLIFLVTQDSDVIDISKDNDVVDIPFEKYKNLEQVQDNPDAQKLKVDILKSDVYPHETARLFNSLLFREYPNSNAALEGRLWVADLHITNTNLRHFSRMSPRYDHSSIYRQAWFILCEPMLEFHSNSVDLLLKLASNGYDTFPQECAEYADKGIALDPSNTDLYIVSSKAYQIMGNYQTALHRLKECKKLLVDKLINELSKLCLMRSNYVKVRSVLYLQLNI